MPTKFSFAEMAKSFLEISGLDKQVFTKYEFILLCNLCSVVKADFDLKAYGSKIFLVGLLLSKFRDFIEDTTTITLDQYKILSSFLFNNCSYEVHSYYNTLLTPLIKHTGVVIYSPFQNKLTALLGVNCSDGLTTLLSGQVYVSGVKETADRMGYHISILNGCNVNEAKDDLKKLIESHLSKSAAE